MRVPLAEVGRRGRLELRFARQNGRTVLEHAYCEAPFKVTRLLHSADSVAHLILMHSTAGIFGGDELECTIHVASGARVLITQQSATRIHPSQGRQAIQRNLVSVETDAELNLFLEPVIPFAESHLRQTTLLNAQEGARLAFWEGFMMGRVGRGERWEFQELASETRLCSGESLVYLDRFRLDPNVFQQSALVMGDNNYLGTGLFLGERASALVEAIHQAIPYVGVDSPSHGLAVMRAAHANGPSYHQCRETFCTRATCFNAR